MHRVSLVCLALAGLFGAAQAPAQDLAYSADISIDVMPFVAADDDIVGDAAGTPGAIELGGLPAAVDVIAYHVADGKPFFVVDAATELPGGLLIDGRDVVLYDGGSYEVHFDGSEKGLPAGVEIDALTMEGEALIFSLDVDAEIDGLLVADEDLVLFDGDYGLLFDGSGLGVPPAYDVDAVSFTEDGQDLVVSFDTGGEVAAVEFYDQDGILWQGAAAFDLYFKGSSIDSSLEAGDLDALMLGGKPVDQGLLFKDGFEVGGFGAWSSASP